MKHKALQFARRVWTRDSNLWLLKEQHQVCLRGPALAPVPCLPCLPRARSARHTLRLESRSARRLPTCLCICSVPCLGEETEPDPIKALGPVEIRPLMVLGDPPSLGLRVGCFPVGCVALRSGFVREHGRVCDLQPSPLKSRQNVPCLEPAAPWRARTWYLFLKIFCDAKGDCHCYSAVRTDPVHHGGLGGARGSTGGWQEGCALSPFGPSLCAVGQVAWASSFAHEGAGFSGSRGFTGRAWC